MKVYLKKIRYSLIVSIFFINLQSLLSVSISNSSSWFTPNNDNKNDTIVFTFILKKQEKKLKLNNWQFVIKNKGNLPIRTFNADTRKMRKGFSLFFIFSNDKKYVKPKIKVPAMIEWDGTDEFGNKVQDGEYSCEFKITDDHLTEYVSEKLFFGIDSMTPNAIISAPIRLITPDGDKKNDIIKIIQKTSSDFKDTWKGEFISASGKIIKTYYWDGSNIASSVNWDGKNEKGEIQPDGIYTYKLTGKDEADNIVYQEINLALISYPSAVDVFADNDKCSPDGDTFTDIINFNLYYQGKNMINSWKLIIFNGEDKKKEVFREFEGGKSLPSSLQWDGKNNKNSYMKDGDYNYQIIVHTAEAEIQSLPRKISIFTVKPEINFKLNTHNFTPDGDELNDYLEITPLIKTLQIKEWKLTIFEKLGIDKKLNMPIKEWSGTRKLEGKLIWHGIKNNQTLIGSSAMLVGEFEFIDLLGRPDKKIVFQTITGILVVPEDKEQYRISLTENEILKKKSILKKAKSIIRRYPGYKIEIQSHTNQSGNDEKNLLQSEKRAKEVFKYLYHKDEPYGRYTFRGCGEIEPLIKSEDVYSMNKNSRIDFLVTEQ